MPGPAAGTSQIVGPRLTTTLPGRQHHFHLTDEEAELRRSPLALGTSHSHAGSEQLREGGEHRHLNCLFSSACLPALDLPQPHREEEAGAKHPQRQRQRAMPCRLTVTQGCGTEGTVKCTVTEYTRLESEQLLPFLAALRPGAFSPVRLCVHIFRPGTPGTVPCRRAVRTQGVSTRPAVRAQ